MKRAIIGGLAVATVLLASSSVLAAPPQAQYSTEDLVNTFAKPPANPENPPAPPQGECEKRGMVTGEDGVCEPRKNERGFSLPTRGAPAAAAPRPAAPAQARPQAAAVARPQAAARPAPKRDLLITFELNSANLTEQARANAKVFADALKSPALSGSKFEIAGYTDASGSADQNLTLSQQRADAVKSFLVGQGIDPSRITSKGFGANDFAVPSNPRSPQNRRVEARRVD